MNLYQFQVPWKQLKASIKKYRQIHIDNSSDTDSGDPDKSASNPEYKYRLPLDYIKDRLDQWDRDKRESNHVW